MKLADKISSRLALLDDVDLSAEDLEAIAADIEDIERMVAELEAFGQVTPWISHQVQPSGRKV
jgi:Asp-tRNA(Asn)/Glu-tRNA(Gln) amidotransferase C subunit